VRSRGDIPAPETTWTNRFPFLGVGNHATTCGGRGSVGFRRPPSCPYGREHPVDAAYSLIPRLSRASFAAAAHLSPCAFRPAGRSARWSRAVGQRPTRFLGRRCPRLERLPCPGAKRLELPPSGRRTRDPVVPLSPCTFLSDAVNWTPRSAPVPPTTTGLPASTRFNLPPPFIDQEAEVVAIGSHFSPLDHGMRGCGLLGWARPRTDGVSSGGPPACAWTTGEGSHAAAGSNTPRESGPRATASGSIPGLDGPRARLAERRKMTTRGRPLGRQG